MKLIRLRILFLLVAAPLFSAENISFSPLTIEDGLSNNSVYCMLQDSYGYMWFGTFSGLNRYDGRGSTVFRPRIGDPGSISGSVIFSLLEDSQGNLWVGTDGGGLNLFNRESLSFSHFRNDPENPVSLPSNQVFTLAEDTHGKLWIGTAGGGLCFYRGEGRFFILKEENSSLIHNRIRSLYCDPGGVLWIGTEKGLSLYDTTTGLFLEGPEFPCVSRLEGLFIRSIVADPEDHIWIGTEQGLFRCSPHTGDFTPFPLPEEASVRSICFDESGIWVGTERSGIFVYDLGRDEWSVIRAEGGPGDLSYGKIRSIYRDHQGLIWVGTRGGGVNLYNPATGLITTYNQAKDIRQMIERQDGSVWIATDGGGVRILDRETGNMRHVDVDPLDPKADDDQVYALLEDHEGNLWIGTDGSGLYSLKAGDREDAIVPVDLKIPGDDFSFKGTVWAILEDHNQTIWIGTEGAGLFAMNRDETVRYTHNPDDPDSLNGNAVRCMLEDSSGQLWIGTWDGGLNLFQQETGSFRSFVRSASRPGSLSDNSVNVIFEDSYKRIWVGTAGGGVNIFQPREKRFRNISSRNGLAGDNIYGILEDENRNLWLSSDKGISMVTPIVEDILNFSRADGLIGNEFSQNAYMKARDGTLFFGGPGGISSFSPGKILQYNRMDQNESRIVLTGMSIHNVPVNIGQLIDGRTILDRDISLMDEIVLPHTANNFSFQFAILSFIDPGKHHYSVQLEGLEEQPRFLGNHNEVSYTAVPPGDYVLNIYGTDHNGLNVSRHDSLVIRILAPFWMNLWFYILSASVLVVLVGWGLWFRVRILERNNQQLRNFTMHMEKAREEERKAAAREYHDELGQQLTAMKFDLYWLNSHPDSEESVRKDKIASLLELVNDSIDSVRSLSTNLRPKVLDNLSLQEALEWQSRRFTKRTGIPLELDIQLDNFRLHDPDGEVKTAVFRMYQEILTNIIRHSGADRVDVLINQDKEDFRLIVRDNGKGIDKSTVKNNNSFGLIGMRERCRHLNGKFFIDNHPEGGSVVRIILPLKESEGE